ncbi:hypothetical protein [Paenibacillus sp. SI8]|uniref:hypothetical protein n=1 Tax=unclassified Paenibacillus TaxID=185978 RepID=UPI003465AC0A
MALTGDEGSSKGSWMELKGPFRALRVEERVEVWSVAPIVALTGDEGSSKGSWMELKGPIWALRVKERVKTGL